MALAAIWARSLLATLCNLAQKKSSMPEKAETAYGPRAYKQNNKHHQHDYEQRPQ
jgi:hypothetical protein